MSEHSVTTDMQYFIVSALPLIFSITPMIEYNVGLFYERCRKVQYSKKSKIRATKQGEHRRRGAACDVNVYVGGRRKTDGRK